MIRHWIDENQFNKIANIWIEGQNNFKIGNLGFCLRNVLKNNSKKYFLKNHFL